MPAHLGVGRHRFPARRSAVDVGQRPGVDRELRGVHDLDAGQPASQVSQNVGRTVSAVDAQTGVHGTATLVAKPFGTQVTVDLAHIQGPLECQFIAVSRTGARFQIGTWFLPPHVKFGSRTHPEHLLLKGWTTIKPGDLSRIDVVAEGHGTQVSIKV